MCVHDELEVALVDACAASFNILAPGDGERDRAFPSNYPCRGGIVLEYLRQLKQFNKLDEDLQILTREDLRVPAGTLAENECRK